MSLLGKMFALTADKFKDVVDKQGKPYILHCIYVMQNCSLVDENSLCTALGHDLIEDTDVTFEFLTKEFNYEIASGINALTVTGSYEDYIKTLATLHPNYTSVNVVNIKLADLTHNMMASRLKGLTKKDFDRMEKYMRAYTYLSKI